jgi:gamma-glutamyltranspeptidase / glutathione hydrolase
MRSDEEHEHETGFTRRELLRRGAILAGGAIVAGVPLGGCDTPAAPLTQSEPTPTPLSLTETPTALSTPTEPPPTATSVPTETPTPTPQPPTPTPTPYSGGGMDVRLDMARNPYTGRRPVVTNRGVVAASQPLAVEAGLEVLRKGGNAIDAALAAAIALTVLEPNSNGLGSDLFALVWDGYKLHGLNASGRAPAGLTLDRVRKAGHRNAMPAKGWLTVTVPGAVAGWGDLHARFGRLAWGDLFSPAVRYVEGGFKVMPTVAAAWQSAMGLYPGLRGKEYDGWRALFTVRGRAPRRGETWGSREMGATLRRISEAGAADFYTGQLAEKIARFARDTGGPMTMADLAAHRSTWDAPISTSYRGYDVWEMPPNGQGIAALLALNILEGLPPGSSRDTPEAIHRQIESMKLAFADAFRYVADPAFTAVPVGQMLDKGYAARRRSLIGERALDPRPGNPYAGGTVYLCASDGEGRMMSLIQSNYMGFGSGVVVPGTGISLHNRGQGFSTDPNRPNSLQPGKRPYHTIIPGFVTKGGAPVGPFGVMGGFMQPQGHLQMVANTIDYAMNPQTSLDAPRWQWVSGRRVQVESTMSAPVIRALRGRGHTVEVLAPSGTFGRGQIIWRLPSGEYVAGTDRRADGYAGSE